MEFEDWVRNEKLKPCPFCGSTDIEIKLAVMGYRAFCRCNDCEAYGPTARTWENPYAMWNQRSINSQDIMEAISIKNDSIAEQIGKGIWSAFEKANNIYPDSTIEKDGVIYHIQPTKGIVVARWADPFNAYEKVYTEMGRIRPLYIQWSDWVWEVIDPLYESFKTMRGIARCMPTDTFDQNTGCQLARAKLKEKWRLRQKKVLNRAYDKHEEVKK